MTRQAHELMNLHVLGGNSDSRSRGFSKHKTYITWLKLVAHLLCYIVSRSKIEHRLQYTGGELGNS